MYVLVHAKLIILTIKTKQRRQNFRILQSLYCISIIMPQKIYKNVTMVPSLLI